VRAKLPEEGSARTMAGRTVFDPHKFEIDNGVLKFDGLPLDQRGVRG